MRWGRTGSRHRQGGRGGLQEVDRGHGRLWEAEGERQQEAEAGSRVRQDQQPAHIPPTLTGCQFSVPAASLAADVSWYLPLPGARAAGKCCPHTLPAHALPGLGDVVGDWQEQKIPSQHGDLPSGRCAGT